MTNRLTGIFRKLGLASGKLGRYISVFNDVHGFMDSQYEARAMYLADQWTGRGGSVNWRYDLYSDGVSPMELSELVNALDSKLEQLVEVVRIHKNSRLYGDMATPHRDIVWELKGNRGLVHFRTDDHRASSTVRFVVKGMEPADNQNRLEAAVLAIVQECGLRFTPHVDESKTPVTYAFPASHGGLRIVDRDFTSSSVDLIADNYAPEVVEKVKAALDVIRITDTGVVVLNGPPGTGKTHLLRAMLSEVTKEKRGVICSPPLTFLNDIGLFANATSEFESSLVIFEDLGDILTKQASTEYAQVYANLLNVTDGLLSLLNSTVLVLTFNTDIGRINEAILRPGRCIAHIEVDVLKREQAQKLLDAAGLSSIKLDKSTYSLAEVYEMKRTGLALPSNNHRNREPAGFVR